MNYVNSSERLIKDAEELFPYIRDVKASEVSEREDSGDPFVVLELPDPL